MDRFQARTDPPEYDKVNDMIGFLMEQAWPCLLSRAIFHILNHADDDLYGLPFTRRIAFNATVISMKCLTALKETFNLQRLNTTRKKYLTWQSRWYSQTCYKWVVAQGYRQAGHANPQDHIKTYRLWNERGEQDGKM